MWLIATGLDRTFPQLIRHWAVVWEHVCLTAKPALSTNRRMSTKSAVRFWAQGVLNKDSRKMAWSGQNQSEMQMNELKLSLRGQAGGSGWNRSWCCRKQVITNLTWSTHSGHIIHSLLLRVKGSTIKNHARQQAKSRTVLSTPGHPAN